MNRRNEHEVRPPINHASISIQIITASGCNRIFSPEKLPHSFSWEDVWQEEHRAAFTVAKAMLFDILRDIREAVDNALAEGTSFEQFRKELAPLLVQKGWWGRANMTDPITGEVKNVQLGSTRRLKIIYDTNLRTSHSEGQ
ncbi:hypothetical protein [Nitrosomonas sp. Is37]|uniref:phage head morphogenesis protein n=1 Tax=Nitrosomonas sp. Is37 TaxID=3080535 RepID=UPI00294AE5F7|nr:hypothetical protein [Nitrosomonas sp. Is37]